MQSDQGPIPLHGLGLLAHTGGIMTTFVSFNPRPSHPAPLMGLHGV